MLDSFVMKVNPTGSEILYSTYLGGESIEWANSIAVDLLGNVYITGDTWGLDLPLAKLFPMTKIHEGIEYCPGYDQIGSKKVFDRSAFVVKLNSNGSELFYSTYITGSEDDFATSIALDIQGNAYVTGTTMSPDFPMYRIPDSSEFIPGFDQTYNGSEDAFVIKLDPTGTELLYSSYLGGKNKDQGSSIAVDPRGNVHVVGNTRSTDFPITVDPFSQTNSGNWDIFVTVYQ